MILSMKVSIVIPAYNEEKWIRRTLERALAQDYPDFEIVVANNASTDRTEAVVRSVQEAYPGRIVLVNEARKGILHAREAGRRAATGEVLAQLDADCLPEPNWLSSAVGNFEDPTVVGVTGIYDYYDMGSLERYGTLGTQIAFLPIVNFFLQKVRNRGLSLGGNFFIRASALEEAGGYRDTDTFYGEDVDTASRIAPYGKIVFSPRTVMKTSARRYKAEGFWKVQKKYNKSTQSVLTDNAVLRDREDNHPR